VPNDALLVDYYAKRAQEYERIYEKPERQHDLECLRKLLRQALAGHDVLEIAAGTGYWTQVAAESANSILATDINEEVLQIARTKKYLNGNASFCRLDAFRLEELPPRHFTAGLAAAWWSHLRRSEMRRFLEHLHQVLPSGALVVFMDNRFVPGSNTPISRRDDLGNTYQKRKLETGEEFEVLKNFPDRQEVGAILSGLATDIEWTELQYYWLLTYRIKP
jgi:SAM-dependent methyltransferase